MQLDGEQPQLFRVLPYGVRVFVNEDTDGGGAMISPAFEKIDDGAGVFRCHITGTFFIEDKAEKVRTVFEGAKGVPATGDAADFYFGRQIGDSRNGLRDYFTD